jgi:hypothetical protein
MTRNFTSLHELIKTIHEHIGYRVLAKPDKSKEISEMGMEICRIYSDNVYGFIPTGFENKDFDRIRALMAEADKIFDLYEKIDAF